MVYFPLNKSVSLKISSEIDAVFKEGKKVSSSNITLYYLECKNNTHLKVAFSVGKKNHGLATNRNKLKRMMKESFRLNANVFLDKSLSFNFVFVFFGTEHLNHSSIEKSMKSLLLSFKNKELS